MPTASRARLAVVGLGRMGRVHADNLATRVGSAQLVAVADAVEPLASSVAARHGVRWSKSLDELVDEPELDGVVIAAPSALHPELVALAATAGKHVFCEKPLGLDVDGCAAAVAAARTYGVELQVGFQRRFDADWRALRAASVEGTLGPLELFRCSHRNARSPEAAELGDVFVDVAIHDLDSACWLAGDIAEVHAALSADGAAATLALRFESGALGLVDVSRKAAYGFECSAELVGGAGTARCGYTARPGGAELLRDGRASAALAADHAERHRAAYVAELEQFGAVALGRAKSEVDGHDALAALRLATLAGRSAALGVPVAVHGDLAGAP
jgi:predicted dehydrogenase